MENFVKIECCECGITFAVSVNFQRNWKENKRIFYCPNGHSQSYRKGTIEILSEEIQIKNSRIISLENEVKRLSCKKRIKTK